MSKENLPVVAAFDFDGTITTRDTLLPFLIECFGLSVAPAALLSFLRSLKVTREKFRDRFKRNILRILFEGKPVAEIYSKTEIHLERIQSWIRPGAIFQIQKHKASGHRLVLVSASLDIYLSHVARRLGFDDLLCTKMEVSGQTFTGRLVGCNCRGPEKVRQLTELLGSFDNHRIIAYGDSAGDREMICAAHLSEYRPFRG